MRPLPQALIGRTALKVFPDDGGRRNYPSTKLYPVNLAGISLEVVSLAFQEQDTVLAACATVALWSAFHKTADLFATGIPTASAITKAGSQSWHKGRPFPSHGLNPIEICSAIKHNGLEPELIEIGPNVPLLSLLYAYLKAGIPVALGLRIDNDYHAVTVVGFSTRQEVQHRIEARMLDPAHRWTVASRIDAFYAHDDQIGPFSKLTVYACNGSSSKPESDVHPLCFKSSWQDDRGELAELHPYVAIVPVYHKIRLTLLDVEAAIFGFRQMTAIVLNAAGISEREWDVHLVYSNDYKNGLVEGTFLEPDRREALLTSSHPRFIWRAALVSEGRIILELLLDATAIARSMPVYQITWYNRDIANSMKGFLENPALEPHMAVLLDERFKNRLTESLDGL